MGSYSDLGDQLHGDRRTTPSFDGRESTEIPVPASIPQGSPCSPILSLFYIAELHDSCEAPELRITVSGCADDTNLLACSSHPISTAWSTSRGSGASIVNTLWTSAITSSFQPKRVCVSWEFGSTRS